MKHYDQRMIGGQIEKVVMKLPLICLKMKCLEVLN